jgi:hypothetical protein
VQLTRNTFHSAKKTLRYWLQVGPFSIFPTDPMPKMIAANLLENLLAAGPAALPGILECLPSAGGWLCL